jgi:catechol 2,3-dioxygenase-like lactoylglutathione lyase family enzyme
LITATDHTSFTVSDVERSVSFYQDTLGFKLLSLAERPPGFSELATGIKGAHLKTAYLEMPGGHRLELIQYLSPPGGKLDPRTNNVGSAHLALIVDDLRAMYRELKGRGFRFKGEPIEIPAGPNKGNWMVYLLDPDDFTLELIQIGAGSGKNQSRRG